MLVSIVFIIRSPMQTFQSKRLTRWNFLIDEVYFNLQKKEAHMISLNPDPDIL